MYKKAIECINCLGLESDNKKGIVIHLMISTIFSQKEIEYIKSQRLARIATAPPSVPSSNEEGEPGGYIRTTRCCTCWV